MEPLTAYLRDVQLSEADFCRRHPYPFLVHTGTGLRPLDETRGLTIDHVVLENESGETNPQPPLRDTFLAAPVCTLDAARRLITIGLSSQCDIQINDASLSKTHAMFELADDAWRIWDNDSVATTQVNGDIVRPGSPQGLEWGDRVTLGYVDLTFLPPEGFYQLVKRLF